MEDDKTAFFYNKDLDQLAKYFVGSGIRYRENIIIPRILGPVQIKSREEKMIEATMESCVFKSGVSCVLGKYLSTIFSWILRKKIVIYAMTLN